MLDRIRPFTRLPRHASIQFAAPLTPPPIWSKVTTAAAAEAARDAMRCSIAMMKRKEGRALISVIEECDVEEEVQMMSSQ